MSIITRGRGGGGGGGGGNVRTVCMSVYVTPCSDAYLVRNDEKRLQQNIQQYNWIDTVLHEEWKIAQTLLVTQQP